jgi:hypothetical protein
VVETLSQRHAEYDCIQKLKKSQIGRLPRHINAGGDQAPEPREKTLQQAAARY